MTLTYGFYNSVASDRLYDAQQMGMIFDGIILDGVYSTLGDYLMVVADTGMQVDVGTGRAWFNHTWTYNDAVAPLTHATADALLPRIDVIYLEINEDTGVRANSLDILEGTPASSPVAGTLTETSTVHQYPLAHVYIGAAVTEITQGNITNMVGTVDTPFITGPLEVITTSEILAGWEAQWEEWFDSIKDQLSTEAETNLQMQIWDLAGVESGAPPYATDMVELVAHDHSAAPFSQVPAGGLETGSVTEAKIAAGAVSTTKLGTNAVATSKISNGAVDNSKLGSNSVSLIKMQDDSVGTNEIIDDAVTNAKVAANAINTTQIVNEAVTAAKIDNRTRSLWVGAESMDANPSVVYAEDDWNWRLPEISEDVSTDCIYGSVILPADWDDALGDISCKVYWFGPAFTGANRWRFRYGPSVLIEEPGPTTLEVTGDDMTGPTIVVKDDLGSLTGYLLDSYKAMTFALSRNYAHAGDDNPFPARIVGFLFEYIADS